jgi:CubicO group peptidase (beta-lactamase class C family)|tara:strand:- start:1165 stop:2343 length:1179 start_codon:yes stop_codon:yes gene_type:complete
MKVLFLFSLFFLSSCIFSSESQSSNNTSQINLTPKTILFWSTEEKINGFKNINEIFPTSLIKKSDSPYPLTYELIDIDNLTYIYKGKKYTIEDYIQAFKVAGLIIIRDGKILHESYNFGNNEESKWISFSVTKSVTSMLLGAAIKDGFINSVKDPVVSYLPQLRGSHYDDVSIEQILHMSSGVSWNEDYTDPNSDVSVASGFNSLKLYDYLRGLGTSSKPGNKFNYNTAETNLIGGLVRSATGNNLSKYLEQKIWKPFGMEFDAYWVLDYDYNIELGGCCINATLRDYARIGIFALNNGTLENNLNILPKNWMKESTTSSPNLEYYGYQWWLDGPNYNSYYADGIFGQFIWIDPDSKTIVAMHSARDYAGVNDFVGGHRLSFMVSLIKEINK